MHKTEVVYVPEDFPRLFSVIDKLDGRYAFVAGGVTINWHGNRTPVLIDLQHLISREIANRDAGVSIGSGARLSDVEEMEDFGYAALHALFDAAGIVASPQIRNMATLGGNLISHLDFSDTLGFHYLFRPDLRLVSREGVVTRNFESFLSDKGRFTFPGEAVLDAFIFPATKLSAYDASCYLKEARVGRDIATIGLTVLKHAGIQKFDIAVGSCWLNVECFRGVSDAEEMGPLIKRLGRPPKSDVRATSWYRQAVLPQLVEKGMHLCLTKTSS